VKKRILLINKSLIVGGIETVLETQYNTLKQNLDVNIILYRRKNQSCISDNEINYIQEYKNLATYVKQQEKQKKFDLIICHAQSERICREVQKLKHPKTIFIIHGMHSAKINTGSVLAKSLRLYRKKKLYRNQNIVTVSEAVQKDFLALNIKPKKIKTIYNPFDVGKLNSLADSKAMEVKSGDYLVWVGRISEVKNLLYLLEVFKHLASKYILRIVGSGDDNLIREMKTRIIELGIEDRVVFEGVCTNPYPTIKNAKALLLTSKSEGLPTVIIESLILNTPVFSTDIPATREILTKFFINGLINISDEKQFSEQLVENISQKLDLNYIHTELSYEKSNLEYLNFFNEA